MTQEQVNGNGPENNEKPDNEKRMAYRLKKAVKRRPVLTFVIAGLVIFFAGIFVASLLSIGGKSGIATVDPSGVPVPGYDKGITEDAAPPDSASDGNQGGTSGENVNAVFDVNKIIYTGSVSLNTDDYKGTLGKIEEYAKTAGGFVQDSASFFMDATQNRDINSGTITIRLPAVKFQEAMKELQKYGTPLNASINSTNISQQYQDVARQLEILQIQESRLLEYLKSAVRIQDMLTIETELNRVRTEIDNRSTMIKNWDIEIAYATIYVTVYEQKLATTEVKSPFNDMLGKIKESFISSINFLLYLTSQAIIWIFKLVPFAVILALVAFIVVWLRKRKTRLKSKP